MWGSHGGGLGGEQFNEGDEEEDYDDEESQMIV
jgi:hypothetical protein